MAVTFDNKSSLSMHNFGTTSRTLSHTTTSEPNRILVVAYASEADQARHPSSMTYAGQALTKAIQVGLFDKAELWYLINPASGANTLSVTFGGSWGADDAGALMVSTYYGVDQVNPINATGTLISSGSGNKTINLTTTKAGCMLTDSFSSTSAADAISAGTGQTTLYDLENIGSGKTDAGSSYKAASTAGSHSMYWSNNSDCAYVALAIAPASNSANMFLVF